MRNSLIFIGTLATSGAVAAFTAASYLDTSRSMIKKRFVSLAGAKEDGVADGSNRSWPNLFRYAVLRLKATEPAFVSSLNREKRLGTFACAGCGSELFSSDAKYDSGSGWPSFTRPLTDDKVVLKPEWDGRVEVTCAKCAGHQGHVFRDGPSALKGGTGMRYCVNGLALEFSPTPTGK